MTSRDDIEHREHDVRHYDGGFETRHYCLTCRRGWSDMNVAAYTRECDEEE